MNILLVCTGNTCRSPMAEALARHLFPKEYYFRSAGIFAEEGAPATDGAIHAMASCGLDLSPHRAAMLTPALFTQADLVLTMTDSQKNAFLRRFFASPEKVQTLYEAAGEKGSIADPYGQSDAVYLQTAREIERLLHLILLRLEEKQS